MTPVHDAAALAGHVAAEPAALVLFGGPSCGVCVAIRPRLEALLAARFPRLAAFYVDCDAHPDVAAQAGVHTRPVVRVYFDGRLHEEHVRVFGIEQVAADIARPYALMFGDADEALLAEIRSAYGSLDHPHFGFVAVRYARRPYAALVAQLELHFEIEETTDLNYDLAVMLSLSGRVHLGLQLSLVGAYGAVTADGRPLERVPDERLASLLDAHHISFMPRSLLLQSILFEGQPRSTYEILFSALPAQEGGHE